MPGREDAERRFLLTGVVVALTDFPARSSLLDLDEGPAEVLRMKEEHRLAVGAGARLAVPEDPGALLHQPVPRRADVVHLVADVMGAAVRIAGGKASDRRECLRKGGMGGRLPSARTLAAPRTQVLLTFRSEGATMLAVAAPNAGPSPRMPEARVNEGDAAGMSIRGSTFRVPCD